MVRSFGGLDVIKKENETQNVSPSQFQRLLGLWPLLLWCRTATRGRRWSLRRARQRRRQTTETSPWTCWTAEASENWLNFALLFSGFLAFENDLFLCCCCYSGRSSSRGHVRPPGPQLTKHPRWILTDHRRGRFGNYSEARRQDFPAKRPLLKSWCCYSD